MHLLCGRLGAELRNPNQQALAAGGTPLTSLLSLLASQLAEGAREGW